MSAFIDAHRHRFGVEPICRTLQVAPSTYYARARRAPSARALSDAALQPAIARVHAANYGVYGARKVWAALNRQGTAVARCTIERLMGRMGLQGVVRGRRGRTTDPDRAGARAMPDLVGRRFDAPGPDRLWVADITYCRTASGFVHAAFVIDAFSRRILGWQMARHLRTELALDALEMAIWTRGEGSLAALVHHSDRGGQYLSIRYGARLGEVGALCSVGSAGDSYDNALAESFIGLFKTELVDRRAFAGRQDLEIAALEWLDWFNHRRLHSRLGMRPPVEFERRVAPTATRPCGPVEAAPPPRVGGAAGGLGVTEMQSTEPL